jgi:hypothetical protein
MAPNESLIPLKRIESLIYLLRGQKAMPDRHLAELYGVETRALNQAVRRNRERFPEDFMFCLTRGEIMRISQIVTSSQIKYSKQVYAFTEQGVAMLSSVLNSPRAVQINIAIMRAFVRLRQMLASNAELAQKLAEMEKRYDAQFKLVLEIIRQLTSPSEPEPPPPRKQIGFHIRERGAPYHVRKQGAAR